MTRRTVLQILLNAPALPGVSEFLRGWHAHGAPSQGENPDAPPEPRWLSEYEPRFFEAADFAALEAFTSILIPSDETPGAREAHCAHFVDFVLAVSGDYALETQAAWRNALRELREVGFHTADAHGRAALVEAASRPERDPTARHPLFGAYQLIKHETVFAFYTSRAGSIDALDYRGNSYNVSFPACTHPEHHAV